MDSGASEHFLTQKELFRTLEDVPLIQDELPDGDTVTSTQRGTISVDLDSFTLQLQSFL